MKNSEIRALVDKWKRWPEWSYDSYNNKCIIAIETLLAREAEVMKWADRQEDEVSDEIRAILKPEENENG